MDITYRVSGWVEAFVLAFNNLYLNVKAFKIKLEKLFKIFGPIEFNILQII